MKVTMKEIHSIIKVAFMGKNCDKKKLSEFAFPEYFNE